MPAFRQSASLKCKTVSQQKKQARKQDIMKGILLVLLVIAVVLFVSVESRRIRPKKPGKGGIHRPKKQGKNVCAVEEIDFVPFAIDRF